MSTFKITGTITDADGSKVDFTAIDTPDYNKVIAMSGMGSVGALSTNFPTPGSGPALPPPIPPVVTRNVFIQPFGVHSIWNQPIGVGTGSFISGGTGAHGGATMKYSNNDGPLYEFAGRTVGQSSIDEASILQGPSSPLRTVFTNTVGWSGGPALRCSSTQTATSDQVPVPPTASYPGSTTSDPCSGASGLGSTSNSSAAILLANRTSLYQMQPMQICTVGGSPTYLPGTLEPNVSIFADESNSPPSAIGAHGGSAMSSIGGVIRMNELIAGNCPLIPGGGVSDVMRHAIAISLNGGGYNAFTPSGHVWPATTNDGGNEGLLLALLPTFNIASLLTPVGKSLAWTCMNYGYYLVDDSVDDVINLATEFSYSDNSVNCPSGRQTCQFQNVWGFTPRYFSNITNNVGKDIATICANFYVITNNSPSNIGGPGVTRLQPLAGTPFDQGVISSTPSVSPTTLQTFNHAGITAGQFIGNVVGSNSPYNWSLSGAGASNFWIQPTTGFIYISLTGVSGITQGAYILTATASNVIGSGSGTVTINVS